MADNIPTSAANKIWCAAFILFMAVWVGLMAFPPNDFGDNRHWIVFVSTGANLLLLVASGLCLRRTTVGQFIGQQSWDVQIFSWGTIALIHLVALASPFTTFLLLGLPMLSLKTHEFTTAMRFVPYLLAGCVGLAAFMAIAVATGWSVVNLKRGVSLGLAAVLHRGQPEAIRPQMKIVRMLGWWAIAIAGVSIFYSVY